MLGKNAAESVKNIFCIEHVYNMAQNAVQKLAMALHSPPPSVDLKEARTLRIDARVLKHKVSCGRILLALFQAVTPMTPMKSTRAVTCLLMRGTRKIRSFVVLSLKSVVF